jgi:archaellum component FlaC
MNKEQLESEIKRLRSELFELKVEYKELLRKYRKVSDELILLKAGK